MVYTCFDVSRTIVNVDRWGSRYSSRRRGVGGGFRLERGRGSCPSWITHETLACRLLDVICCRVRCGEEEKRGPVPELRVESIPPFNHTTRSLEGTMSRITSRIKPEDEDASLLKFGPGNSSLSSSRLDLNLPFSRSPLIAANVEFEQVSVQQRTLTISEVKVILDTIELDKQPDNSQVSPFPSPFSLSLSTS